MDEVNTKANTTRNHRNLIWTQKESADLSADIESPLLSNNQKVTFSRIKGSVGAHIAVGAKDIDCQAGLNSCVTSSSYQTKACDEIHILENVEGVPSQLIRNLNVFLFASFGMT